MGRFRLLAAFAAIYVIWGSTYLAIRIALESFPPFVGAGLRFTIAGLVLYAWRRLKGAPRPTLRQWRTGLVVGATLMVGGNGLVFFAEQSVPSGVAALMVATLPLWTALLGVLWTQDRLAGRGWLGLALGFAGVAVLVGPANLAGTDRIDPVGAIALLTASLSWASGSLYSRQAPEPARPLMATALAMLAGGAILFLLGTVTGEVARFDLAAVSLRAWLALAYLIGLGSLVALSAYIWLLHEAPPSRVATYAYVNPVVAVALGWLLADEAIDLRIGIATVVIVAGVALILTARIPVPRAKPACPEPVLEH